jgi:hypothetical protein
MPIIERHATDLLESGDLIACDECGRTRDDIQEAIDDGECEDLWIAEFSSPDGDESILLCERDARRFHLAGYR